MVQVPRRDELRAFLTRAASAPRFTIRCRFIARPASRTSATAAGRFPHADAAAARVLALPIFGELRDDQLQQVVGAIADFLSA